MNNSIDFDAVVDFEMTEYEKGEREGIIDGLASGFEKDGLKAGFLKGFEFGMELGFYEKSLLFTINSLNRNDSKYENKLEKLTSLLSIIQNMNNFNNSEIDYGEIIQSIRTKYQSSPSHSVVGPLLNSKLHQDHQSEDW
jgi:hypothetical protein